jgi:hypothetical protein
LWSSTGPRRPWFSDRRKMPSRYIVDAFCSIIRRPSMYISHVYKNLANAIIDVTM